MNTIAICIVILIGGYIGYWLGRAHQMHIDHDPFALTQEQWDRFDKWQSLKSSKKN